MQNRRGLMFLALAVLLGLGAAFMAREFTGNTPAAQAANVPTKPVVVANLDLGTADALSAAELKLVDWPSNLVPAGAIHAISGAEGRVTRRPIVAGEPVLEGALFDQGADGGLVAVISPEFRAVSVKVDSVIGVAGFIKPGARVDVLATVHRVDMQDRPPFSKVILQDVRVLAIDQKLEEAKDGEAQLVSVVTLEVKPDSAQKLIYSAHEGRLQLALRTPGDDKLVELAAIAVRDVLGAEKKASAPKAVAPSHRRGAAVQVIRGSKVETETF
jgi:pilus assembly protein CpaB